MAVRDLESYEGFAFQWTGLEGNDTGDPLRLTNRGGVVAAIQLTGTFGGTVTMQGSLDGTNWFTLKDTQGNDVSATADALFEVSTAVRHVRPSAGSGVSSVAVIFSTAN